MCVCVCVCERERERENTNQKTPDGAIIRDTIFPHPEHIITLLRKR